MLVQGKEYKVRGTEFGSTLREYRVRVTAQGKGYK